LLVENPVSVLPSASLKIFGLVLIKCILGECNNNNNTSLFAFPITITNGIAYIKEKKTKKKEKKKY